MTATQTAWGLHPDPTADGLMRSVVEHPFDTAVRLVLADRLDEVGEAERAEFIRLSADLDTDPNRLPLDEFIAANRRERDLFAAHSAEWFGANAFIESTQPASVTPCLLVRRGLVEAARCPLVWWLGGERADPRHADPAWPGSRCGGCHGTGTTPGHGAAVVSRHPVTKVVVTPDPIWQRGDGKWVAGDGRWLGAVVGTDPAETPLPVDVWEAFSDPDKGWPYPTREAAVEALSRALVGIAREQAGLPAIPWEVSQ